MFELVFATSAAHAVAYRIQSETTGDSYQLVTSDNELIHRYRLHQYLGFGAHDLLSDGQYQLSISTLFRFDADFGMDEDEDPAQLDTLGQERLSIQMAVLEGRNLFGMLDFKLGRQFVPDPMDFLMLDGAVITLRTPWYVGLEFQAGVEATNELGPITSSQLALDGVRFIEGVQEVGEPRIVLGGSLLLTGLTNTRARFGYRRIFTGGRVNQERVAAAFYQRLFDILHLDGQFAYDFFRGEVDTVRTGVRLQATTDWTVEVEYVHLLPIFDADSIFNIFATYPLNDVNGRVRWHIDHQSHAYVGGMVRLFANEAYDGTLVEPVDTGVSAFGAMAGYRRRFDELGSYSLNISYEGGYGGQRVLFDTGGRWSAWPGYLDIDGRITTVYFDDELQAGLHAVSFGYQLGARYLIGKEAAIQFTLEHNINRLQKTQLRAFLLADFNLWL
jgi:hypothetical protein